jgi:shikimate kinase / 3-dehydroquinate synthase
MIVLVGFMGAGKSTSLTELRGRGLKTADTDRLVEQAAGASVAELFRDRGESAFREIEQDVVLRALEDESLDALALGGGAVTSEPVRQALAESGRTVVWLEIDQDVAWRRVRNSDRPLAKDEAGFRRLFDERLPLYESVADAILPAASRRIWSRAYGSVEMLPRLPKGTRLLWAASANGDYPVFVGRGLLDSEIWAAGGALMPAGSRSFLFTDDAVGPIYGARIPGLDGAISVPPGEGTKTVSEAERALREMARMGITRSDRMVALGGGVVGDLGGFCAATYQRGIPVVQVPTTLVAQVDSAYGGKTGVDLPEGKNYVGSFHLPEAVVTDVDALGTLPPEELTAGMAEVVKTALLAGGVLWQEIRGLESGAITSRPDLVFACARYKCGVVAADERDRGLRAVLNLGHTVGHAIEAATSYERYRHGEAVALGLLAALRLSDAVGLRDEVRGVLETHGLPVTLDASVSVDEIVEAVSFDKKKTRRGVGFVLLAEPGEPRTDCLVETGKVGDAVKELTR